MNGVETISIIVPVLDEADTLPDLLTHLKAFRHRGCEVLLVDGGSEDASVIIAARAGFTVVKSSRGRARQMNAGAAAACGDLLVFLHADTLLPADADRLIRAALVGRAEAHAWGFFRIRIAGGPGLLRVVGLCMNQRSRLTGIATGDQALFVRRTVFEQAGGFPDQSLMEDIELSRRLKRFTSPLRLHACATTSGRRWASRGVWRTIFLMWRLRLAYWLGVHPDTLAKSYR